MGFFNDWYCLMNGTTYKEFASESKYYGMQDPQDKNSVPEDTYLKGKEKISKRQFDRIIKKYTDGKSIKTPHFHKNTYCDVETKKS